MPDRDRMTSEPGPSRLHRGVGAAWRPALDKVWAFLRTKPDLRTDGHNVFLYHHPARRDMPMDVDFGVNVVRAFEPEGEVHAVETPAGARQASAIPMSPCASASLISAAVTAERSSTAARIIGFICRQMSRSSSSGR